MRTVAHDTAEAWAHFASGSVRLDELAAGALLISAHAYPGLDVDARLSGLAAMADTLRARLRPDISPADKIVALNHYLFGELGFRGNAGDYYDPRNSYLNDVLERRLGIPISLSVLYIDLGRRLGLPLEGVSFPSHFLVKCKLRTGTLVLDPFERGASLGVEALRRRLGLDGVPGQDDEARVLASLRAATVPEILARMLRNLRAIHLHRGELQDALWAADRIVTLQPRIAAEYRERGLIYLELECFRAALEDLRAYAQLAPGAAQAEGLAATIAELEVRASRLN